MNWTEGNLARHSRSRQPHGKEELLQQKQHFAKARSKPVVKKSPLSDLYSSSFAPHIPHISRRAVHNFRSSHAPSSPIGKLPQAQRGQKRVRGSEEDGEEPSGSSRYFGQTDGTAGRREQSSVDADDIILAKKRRRLLTQGEWTQHNLQKPVSLLSSTSSSCKKIWRNPGRFRLSSSRQLPRSRRDRDRNNPRLPEFASQSSIRIRIGSQVNRHEGSSSFRGQAVCSNSVKRPRTNVRSPVHSGSHHAIESRAVWSSDNARHILTSSPLVFQPVPLREIATKILCLTSHDSDDADSTIAQIGRHVSLTPLGHSIRKDYWTDMTGEIPSPRKNGRDMDVENSGISPGIREKEMPTDATQQDDWPADTRRLKMDEERCSGSERSDVLPVLLEHPTDELRVLSCPDGRSTFENVQGLAYSGPVRTISMTTVQLDGQEDCSSPGEPLPDAKSQGNSIANSPREHSDDNHPNGGGHSTSDDDYLDAMWTKLFGLGQAVTGPLGSRGQRNAVSLTATNIPPSNAVGLMSEPPSATEHVSRKTTAIDPCEEDRETRLPCTTMASTAKAVVRQDCPADDWMKFVFGSSKSNDYSNLAEETFKNAKEVAAKTLCPSTSEDGASVSRWGESIATMSLAKRLIEPEPTRRHRFNEATSVAGTFASHEATVDLSTVITSDMEIMTDQTTLGCQEATAVHAAGCGSQEHRYPAPIHGGDGFPESRIRDSIPEESSDPTEISMVVEPAHSGADEIRYNEKASFVPEESSVPTSMVAEPAHSTAGGTNSPRRARVALESSNSASMIVEPADSLAGGISNMKRTREESIDSALKIVEPVHSGIGNTDKTKFVPPKMFVGKLAGLTDSGRQTAVQTVRPARKMKRVPQKGKKPRDNRANIRALPNYSSDPIEDIVDEGGRSRSSLFRALETH